MQFQSAVPIFSLCTSSRFFRSAVIFEERLTPSVNTQSVFNAVSYFTSSLLVLYSFPQFVWFFVSCLMVSRGNLICFHSLCYGLKGNKQLAAKQFLCISAVEWVSCFSYLKNTKYFRVKPDINKRLRHKIKAETIYITYRRLFATPLKNAF